MIIDLIADRLGRERAYINGELPAQVPGGTVCLIYDPHDFYIGLLRYGDRDISRAMDYGSGWDVKRELIHYLIANDYSRDFIGYVRSRDWLHRDVRPVKT